MFIPACLGNTPDTVRSRDALCAEATQACETTPNPTDIAFWVFLAPAGPPAPGPNDFRYANQTVCRGVRDIPAAAVPVLTANDFRRLPIPPGRVHIEPPDLRTLINVPTNVYVEAAPVLLPTTLLGLPVRVRATPARYAWAFGDGATLSTSDPGAAYPDLRTTHTYRQPGRVQVRLRTAYDGEYSVAGGPWLAVDGQAQVTGPAVPLTVLAARNVLVAPP